MSLKFTSLKGRVIESKQKTERDLPTAGLFPKWHNGQEWVRPKTGVSNPIWVVHMGGIVTNPIFSRLHYQEAGSQVAHPGMEPALPCETPANTAATQQWCQDYF